MKSHFKKKDMPKKDRFKKDMSKTIKEPPKESKELKRLRIAY